MKAAKLDRPVVVTPVQAPPAARQPRRAPRTKMLLVEPEPPPNPMPVMRPQTIIEAVLMVCVVSREDLAGKGKHPREVAARMLCTRLLHEHTLYSYPEIARLIGRPNHSTVITADKRLERLLSLPDKDPRRLIRTRLGTGHFGEVGAWLESARALAIANHRAERRPA